MSEIFSKTVKGQEEVKTRAGGLSQRMRQVLIFTDGKRSRDDLYGMLKGDDLNALIDTLLAQGLIEVTGTVQAKMAAAPRPATPAAAPVAAPRTVQPAPVAAALSAEEKQKRQREEEAQAELAMARSFMGRMS